jgi:hypothetical protein
MFKRTASLSGKCAVNYIGYRLIKAIPNIDIKEETTYLKNDYTPFFYPVLTT